MNSSKSPRSFTWKWGKKTDNTYLRCCFGKKWTWWRPKPKAQINYSFFLFLSFRRRSPYHFWFWASQRAVDRAEMLALGQGISETKNYAYPIWILTLSEIRGGRLLWIKMLKIKKKKYMRKKSSHFLNN